MQLHVTDHEGTLSRFVNQDDVTGCTFQKPVDAATAASWPKTVARTGGFHPCRFVHLCEGASGGATSAEIRVSFSYGVSRRRAQR